MTYDNRLINQTMMQTQAIPNLDSGSTELIDRLFYNTQNCTVVGNGALDPLNEDPLFDKKTTTQGDVDDYTDKFKTGHLKDLDEDQINYRSPEVRQSPAKPQEK